MELLAAHTSPLLSNCRALQGQCCSSGWSGMLPDSSCSHFSRRSPLRPPKTRRNTNFLIATQQSWILAQKLFSSIMCCLAPLKDFTQNFKCFKHIKICNYIFQYSPNVMEKKCCLCLNDDGECVDFSD